VAAKATTKGASIRQIMDAADWSSKHNFIKFYKKEIDTGLSLSILQPADLEINSLSENGPSGSRHTN
jgi:hypothetical protein